MKMILKKSRPIVIGIKSFNNGAQDVKPRRVKVVVEFSAVMDKRYRNFELGPLGIDNLMRAERADFSADGKSITLEVNLEANKRYQLELAYQFRSQDGKALKPYLIDFKTSSQ